MKILALDLGRLNTMCCFFDTATREHRFFTAATDPGYLSTVFQGEKIDKDDAFKLARMVAINKLKNAIRARFFHIVT